MRETNDRRRTPNLMTLDQLLKEIESRELEFKEKSESRALQNIIGIRQYERRSCIHWRFW